MGPAPSVARVVGVGAVSHRGQCTRPEQWPLAVFELECARQLQFTALILYSRPQTHLDLILVTEKGRKNPGHA